MSAKALIPLQKTLRFQKGSLRPRRHASHLPEGLFVFHRAQFILSAENNQG